MACSCSSFIRGTAGVFVTLCFLLLAAFEAALAVRAPIIEKVSVNELPITLRYVSGVAAFLWIFATGVILQRSGLVNLGLSHDFALWATYGLTAGWVACTVLNFISDSHMEREIWGPITTVLATVCLYLSCTNRHEEDEEEERAGLNEPFLPIV